MQSTALDLRRVSVGDVMTREVLTVRDDMTAAEAASFLLDHEISGAPVVDAQGRLVGVLSLVDVARSSTEQGSVAVEPPEPEYFQLGRLDGWEESYAEQIERLHVEGAGMLVLDIMTPVVVTVTAQASLAEVAAIMVAGHYHRLLVTRDGELAGIVTSMDLLRLLAE